MRPLHYSFLLILLNCLSLHVSAGTLTGAVRDAKGNPLPFATVFVAGTTNGTVASASGIYQLTLPAGAYDVTCQYIGYQQTVFKLTIGAEQTVQHDFNLKEQALEMSEFVLRASDEDPAYRIIRQAIAKREFHLRQVEEFQTSIYLKGVMRTREAPDKLLGQKIDKGELGMDTTGKGVIYLCEEVADYYAQRPGKQRTVIHSVRESGNPNGLGLSSLPPVVSFYANNVISINNSRGLISPIAANALGYYRYKLEGEFREGRNTIYKIRVIPKRPYEPLCFGHIYIVDGDWAIHSLSLATSTRYGLDMLDTLRMDQLFLPLKKDVWVIKNQQLFFTLKIFGFGLAGNFVTVYDNQKVNQPVPDTIFNKKIIATYDPAANKKDTAYWEETRPLALEDDEARDYRYKDSLLKVLEDPRRIDSLRRRENRVELMEALLNGITFNDSGYRSSLRISPLVGSVNFNSVEGLNLETELTMRRKLDSSSNLILNTAFRYGFTNTHFNGIAALTYEHNDPAWQDRRWSLSAEGGQYVFQYDRHNPVTPLFNTFTTLLFRYNTLKIYERLTGALYFRRNAGNGFRWWARAAWERRMPLENTTAYSWIKGDSSQFTDNLPAELKAWKYETHDAVVARLGISWQPGYRYVMYPDHRRPVPGDKPTFTLQYEKGIPGILGSSVDWDKWQAAVSGNIPLRLFGNIDYRLSGAGFFNNQKVGIPDLIHPFAGDDPEFTLASPYLQAFQLAPFYRFSNDASLYGEAHIEYNLMGLLTNKVPGLRQAKWYLILGTNTFYAREDLFFAEAFVSIDNLGFKIFRVLRVDFLHAWDAQRRTYNGIRLGITWPALQQLRGGGGDLEWL
jgi:hypothetical protein